MGYVMRLVTPDVVSPAHIENLRGTFHEVGREGLEGGDDAPLQAPGVP